ncbi:hypothetical protein [Methylobacterium sp. J-068]|uniref:hypothetical protein n=1 Tax=Methylobacterium sp. J-068 TaxID=2836649 RepID=UPI001FBABAAD|nr:hypothetical protein [Methylobacterium sp. J-068]MCJ2036713.1 hypothetical protein [Methylobacterium sp. J-068]
MPSAIKATAAPKKIKAKAESAKGHVAKGHVAKTQGAKTQGAKRQPAKHPPAKKSPPAKRPPAERSPAKSPPTAHRAAKQQVFLVAAQRRREALRVYAVLTSSEAVALAIVEAASAEDVTVEPVGRLSKKLARPLRLLIGEPHPI